MNFYKSTKSVTHFKFNNYFDKPIKSDTIPVNVTHLEFGNEFNQL